MNQSVAIVLAITTADKERIEELPAVSLRYEGQPVAILRRPQIYAHRKEERVCRQFGTEHRGHPYIKVTFDFEFIKNHSI